VNTSGELVGINSQILSNSDGNIGIGFSIPANMAKHVMETSARRAASAAHSWASGPGRHVGHGRQPWLEARERGDCERRHPGSARSGPASSAGRDRVVHGQPVHDTNTLRNRVAETGPGTTATFDPADGSERI